MDGLSIILGRLYRLIHSLVSILLLLQDMDLTNIKLDTRGWHSNTG